MLNITRVCFTHKCKCFNRSRATDAQSQIVASYLLIIFNPCKFNNVMQAERGHPHLADSQSFRKRPFIPELQKDWLLNLHFNLKPVRVETRSMSKYFFLRLGKEGKKTAIKTVQDECFYFRRDGAGKQHVFELQNPSVLKEIVHLAKQRGSFCFHSLSVQLPS